MMRGRGLVNSAVRHWAALLAAVLIAAFPARAAAEDGYALWLRYAPLERAQGDALIHELGDIRLLANPDSPTIKAMMAEFDRALPAMAGEDSSRRRDPRLVIGLRATLLAVSDLGPDVAERTAWLQGAAHGAWQIGRFADGRWFLAANDEIGLLYGSFGFLRHLQATGSLDRIEQVSSPVYDLRMVDHWDNPDGSVERGYAGRSIFDWWRLPEYLDQRLIDYARAEASLGINAVGVNNVNARADMLTPRYIAKLKRIADAWRPFGIRVFLSARFSAPRDIGGLPTADPLDPAVHDWWVKKSDEIYAAIPDFGGFLVKANSEGQPGPGDYGRTHADGANMLASALGERGTVIWRAFVYSTEDQTDRAKQAYNEFAKLDGKFAKNVIVQVKNGPIDFQPREPFHPLFGAMPNTRLMLELQVTKEYLGQATHLTYLAPMWSEVLDADTGRGGTVAQIVRAGGMAGVANTGSDRNWSGSHFNQADWYAFGRLSWDPTLSADAIAREWAAQTFSREPQFLDKIVPLMVGSREAAVDYMTPLGLTHQMATGHHYGPGPWVCDLARPEWNPCYYSRADKDGIGFDRTKTGSDGLAQYAPAVAAQWSDPTKTDERLLLWFHHVPWDFRMKSGRSLWAELVASYDRGVACVDRMAQEWQALEPFVDSRRFADTAAFLEIQRKEARWWRDASLTYWQSINGLPLPEEARPPEHTLDYYKALSFPEAPGN